MLRIYANFVTPLLKLHLGEEFRACNVVQKFINVRQAVPLLQGDVVECANVSTRLRLLFELSLFRVDNR